MLLQKIDYLADSPLFTLPDSYKVVFYSILYSSESLVIKDELIVNNVPNKYLYINDSLDVGNQLPISWSLYRKGNTAKKIEPGASFPYWSGNPLGNAIFKGGRPDVKGQARYLSQINFISNNIINEFFR